MLRAVILHTTNAREHQRFWFTKTAKAMTWLHSPSEGPGILGLRALERFPAVAVCLPAQVIEGLASQLTPHKLRDPLSKEPPPDPFR